MEEEEKKEEFQHLENELMKEKLENRYDFEFNIYQHKIGQYTLHSTKSNNTKKILKDINDYFPLGMERKSMIWRTPDAKLNYIKEYPPCKWCKGIKIYSIGTAASGKKQYKCLNCIRTYIFPYC